MSVSTLELDKIVKVADMTICYYFTFQQHNQTSSHLSRQIPAQEKGTTSILIVLVGFQKTPLCLRKAGNQGLRIKPVLTALPIPVALMLTLRHRQKLWGPCLPRKRQPQTLLSRTPMTVTMTQS